MRFGLVFKVIGRVLQLEAVCLVLPLIIALLYEENDAVSFLISIIIAFTLGSIFTKFKTDNFNMNLRNALAAAATSWLFLSIAGALPFYFSGYFNSFTDALFESISGFTTTGATILNELEVLPHGILFWRSFIHWIGGMGVLVFVLAVTPSSGASNVQLLRAESPGPSPGKIVPKLKDTAKIMYLIYLVLTLIQILLLVIVGMPLFDAVIHALSTAGTGGFSNKTLSIGAYGNIYIEIIITVFMLIFSINFYVYHIAMTKSINQALKNEEMCFFLIVVMISMTIITLNTISYYDGSFLTALRYSSFQTVSIVSTTGFATYDLNLWPTLSKFTLIFLMLMGGCAGSTAGGIKSIRFLVLFKALKTELNKMVHPRLVDPVKIDGKLVEPEIITGIHRFIIIYIFIFFAGIFFVSLDNKDIVTTFASVISTLSNVGPGPEIVDPTTHFGTFSTLSKYVFCFCMLAGRLEIFPLVVLLNPSLWKKT